MMWWEAYVRWFTEHYDALSPDLIEVGAVECNGGPSLRTTDARFPRSAPWRAEWAVIYPDGYYFRVKECFKPIGAASSRPGEREHFSFHYGRAHPELDRQGYPKTQPSTNPPDADLRIDIDSRPDIDGRLRPHIHVGSREHLWQNRVQGYDIEKASMVDFLIAVRQHRKTKEALTDLLKITVLPAGI
jgi:hypothetical protein